MSISKFQPETLILRCAGCCGGGGFFSTVLLNYLFVANCCASVKYPLTELHLYVCVFIGNLRVRNQSEKPGCLRKYLVPASRFCKNPVSAVDNA